MLGLKLNHVCERGPRDQWVSHQVMLHCNPKYYVVITWIFSQFFSTNTHKGLPIACPVVENHFMICEYFTSIHSSVFTNDGCESAISNSYLDMYFEILGIPKCSYEENWHDVCNDMKSMCVIDVLHISEILLMYANLKDKKLLDFVKCFFGFFFQMSFKCNNMDY